MSGFEKPNYTQAPNALFDKLLPLIDNLAELKVTLVAVRQTIGFHREEDEISLSRFVELTGLHKSNVIEGIKRAMKRGTLVRRKVGQTYLYRLKVVANHDQSRGASSRESRQQVVANHDQQVVANHDPQKKGRKKEKESNTSPRGADAPQIPREQEDEKPAKAMTSLTVDRTREVGFDAARGQIEAWGKGWSNFIYVPANAGEEPPSSERQFAVLGEIVDAAAGKLGSHRFFMSVEDAVARVDDEVRRRRETKRSSGSSGDRRTYSDEYRRDYIARRGFEDDFENEDNPGLPVTDPESIEPGERCFYRGEVYRKDEAGQVWCGRLKVV